MEQVLIIPGFTPRLARQPIPLHPRARRRVERALRLAQERRIRWIITSGGAVYPTGTPCVEADGMADELVRLGWPREHIVRERRARHTYANLRNSGRLMLRRGWTLARVVTGLSHAAYMGFPELSRFEAHTRAVLGYFPGHLRRDGPGQLLFQPWEVVFTPGPDPLDP
jgi:hypothetical protein